MVKPKQPKLCVVPSWDKEPIDSRLVACAVQLMLEGVLTEVEYRKVINRVNKKVKQGYFDAPESA